MSAECPGGIDTCTCGPGYVWASQLYRDQAARQYLIQLRADLGNDAGLVRLSHDAGVSSLAEALAEFGPYLARHIRHELREDVEHLRWVRRLEQLADGYPDDFGRTLAALTPDEIRRADTTEALIHLTDEAIELAASAMLKLSGATEPAQRTIPAAVPRVMHTMLSDPRVRSRLRLAGHPSNRRAMGYGRLTRGAAAAVADEEQLPDRAVDAEPPEGSDVPEKALSASRGRAQSRRPVRRSRARGGR